MRDLKNIYRECVEECKNMNIPIREEMINEVNTNLCSIYGEGRGIKKRENNSCEIQLSPILLMEEYTMGRLKGIIIHNLLHTCIGCQKHTTKWYNYAKIMEAKYGYEIIKVLTKEVYD